MKTAAVAIAAVMMCSTARAEVLRNDALCSVAVAALDSQNRQAIGYVVQRVVDVMEGADEDMAASGQAAILASAPDSKLLDLVAFTTAQCRLMPQKTLRLVATQVYFAERLNGNP